MRRDKTLTLKRVELYGTEQDGTEWKMAADEAVIRLRRNGTFTVRLRALWPWGKCEGQIIRLADGRTVVQSAEQNPLSTLAAGIQTTSANYDYTPEDNT